MIFLSREDGRTKLNIPRNVVNCTLEGRALELVQITFDVLMKYFALGLLLVVVHTYLSFSPVVIEFQVLSELSDRVVLLKQEGPPFEGLLGR